MMTMTKMIMETDKYLKSWKDIKRVKLTTDFFFFKKERGNVYAQHGAQHGA